MKAVVVDLREREKQLSVTRRSIDDDTGLEDVKNDQECIELTRRAVSQYQTVCEWIERQTVATQTGQDIGNVTLTETSYAAVGMSNIGKVMGIKQTIGDVSVGAKSVAFVGVHNRVDHGAHIPDRQDASGAP